MTPLPYLLALTSLSFVLSLGLTPLARIFAFRVHLVDEPDGYRKLHRRPIPLAGGLAIFFASCLTLGLALRVAPADLLFADRDVRLLPGLLLASLVICVVGVVDDHRPLRGRQKLCGQIVAVLIVMLFGVEVRLVHFCGWQVDLGLFAFPFTGFLLLGAINSLNLLDGMDGLLCSVGTVICVGIAGMAALGGHWLAAAVAVTLAGAVLGFLFYNLPPAGVFLGDAGSMLIGLVVGVLAIQSSLKGPATIVLAAPVALLTIPIFDTSAAIVRRKLTGRSLYATDQGHLHHCLQRRGFTGYRILLLVGGLCLITSVGALCSTLYNNEGVALLSAFMVVGTLILTRLFGHAEAGLIHARLKATLLSLRRRTRIEPAQQEIRLQGEAPWSAHWHQLTECAGKLHLTKVLLDIHAPFIGEGYHARWESGQRREAEALWHTDVPLLSGEKIVGRIHLAGDRDALGISQQLAVILDVVEDVEATIVSLGTSKAPAGAPLPALAEDVTLPDREGCETCMPSRG